MKLQRVNFIRAGKIAACGFAVILIAPLLMLVIWYAVSFLPYLGELRALQQRGHDSTLLVRSNLHGLALAGESEEGIRTWAMRQAYAALVFNRQAHRGTGQMTWLFGNLLWYGASWINLDSDEAFDVWADCALGGCGHDFQDAAHKYFSKDLSELSQIQLASLVAAVRGPTQFPPGSELGLRRAHQILSESERKEIRR